MHPLVQAFIVWHWDRYGLSRNAISVARNVLHVLDVLNWRELLHSLNVLNPLDSRLDYVYRVRQRMVILSPWRTLETHGYASNWNAVDVHPLRLGLAVHLTILAGSLSGGGIIVDPQMPCEFVRP